MINKAYIGTEIGIAKNNKLIDDFMGERPKRHLYDYEVNCFYHTSWSWLMPVVEKISEINNMADEELLEHIKLTEEETFILHIKMCGPSIKTTWIYVVQFIQWYNTQTKKQ